MGKINVRIVGNKFAKSVIMGRKEHSATDVSGDVLEHGTGNGRPIICTIKNNLGVFT